MRFLQCFRRVVQGSVLILQLLLGEEDIEAYC